MRSVAEFALAAGVLTVIPGPDTLLALRTAVAHGRTPGARGGGRRLHRVSGLGLRRRAGADSRIGRVPGLVPSLRWAGVAYLAYLGLRLLVAGSRAPAATSLGSQSVEELTPPAAAAQSAPADRASMVGRASAGDLFRRLAELLPRGPHQRVESQGQESFTWPCFPSSSQRASRC